MKNVLNVFASIVEKVGVGDGILERFMCQQEQLGKITPAANWRAAQSDLGAGCRQPTGKKTISTVSQPQKRTRLHTILTCRKCQK